MTDKELIIEKAQNYDVISFDVFDTLLIRDVMVPADIFTLSYGSFGRYVRILAEMKARKKSKMGEVTLDDIDRNCIFSCQKELGFETEYCRANPVMLEIYEKLKESGKKMYAISDMYLSSDFIGKLLKNAGFDMPVMVSCEENAGKTDGVLFKKFLEKYSLSSGAVLHIGDSKTADCEGAKAAGIEPFLIEKHTDLLSYTGYSRRNPELSSFTNHGLNEIPDPVERIGYEIVGPIIFGFCGWIHEKYRSYGFERLYFLARDMRFTFEMYKYLYPDDDARYLCVSRKSLNYGKEHPVDICEYFKKEGCFGNAAVVDTGWIGNAQVEIDAYAKMIDASSDIGGLYLGSKLAYRKLARSKRSDVFLYSSRLDQFKCQLFPPFMETLIGCNEKQVISYKNGLPEFDRDESRDHTNLIKSGAARFITDLKCIGNNKSISAKDIRKPFEKLFYKPKSEHISLIGSLHYEDFKDTKIVSFDEECNYLIKPGKLLADLGDSGWKGAFFKKIGGPFSYLLFGFYFLFGPVRIWKNDLKQFKNH